MAERAPKLGHITEDDWVGQAWALYLRGERNWSALGRQFGKKRDTVRANIIKYAAQRDAEEATGPGARADYIDGLEADLRDTERLMRETDEWPVKVACLRHITDIRELLAAVRGVATKREALEFGGTVNVRVVMVPAPDGGGNGNGNGHGD